MKCSVLFAATTMVTLGVSILWAGDEKTEAPKGQGKAAAPGKLDLEALFKKLDVDGDGKISLEEFKKIEQFYPAAESAKKFGKGANGKGSFDPEKLKKLMEKIGGGKGNLDPDAIKKMLEKFKGKGGTNLDLEQLLPLVQQLLPDGPGVEALPKTKAAEKK